LRTVTVVQGRPDASILIPTYNAVSNFEETLEAISAQRSDFTYEVLVDSGGGFRFFG
jgi:glycosyltransferase involved in cell wall biosynthesis